MIEIDKLMTLEQIKEKYPVQKNYSEATDRLTGKERTVFSLVRRNEQGKIVYVEPGSIRWNDSVESDPIAKLEKTEF